MDKIYKRFLLIIQQFAFLNILVLIIAGCDNRKESGKNYEELQKIAQEKAGISGEVGSPGIDLTQYLTTWNFSNLPESERKKVYREYRDASGRFVREYHIWTENKEIEIAKGIKFPAWTYNGQVPGPTIRATEGDWIRVIFKNQSNRPHTIHFHGLHPAEMDGSMPADFVYPGQEFIYEFEAIPYGIHLYHCHSVPLTQHIHKGLYGVYIVDPKNDTRPKAERELVMLMNGFDTNFDGENEVYALNTVAFYYNDHPIMVKKNELVRIYLVNILEFDPVNSFHVHANFFQEYKTGTRQTPDHFTDTIMLAQAERSILDIRFPYTGMYMFHAHKTEFAEKGWMSQFMVHE